MTKQHYIQIAICSLLIVICSLLFYGYYRDYIAPESYVVGTTSDVPYKQLMVSEYLSDDSVLFSKNINKQSFSIKNNIAVYEYNFIAVDFDADKFDYSLFVNNDIVLHNDNAGTLTGVHSLRFYDVNKNCLSTIEINIDFAFYSLHSTLRVSLDASKLGYLMNYFKTDNYIITLSHSIFNSRSQIEVDQHLINLMVDNTSEQAITIIHNEKEIVVPAVTTKTIEVKATDHILVKNITSYVTYEGLIYAYSNNDGVVYSWVDQDSLYFTFSSKPIYST